MTAFAGAVNGSPMESFRDLLPGEFVKRMQSELGRQETLRILWPVMVGARLGCNTRLKEVRHSTLVVSVPDRTWKKTLSSMEGMILDAVRRFSGEESWQAIEFVEDPLLAVPRQDIRPQRPDSARSLPPVDLPVEAISDAELREMFLRSARKYFARQEVPSR